MSREEAGGQREADGEKAVNRGVGPADVWCGWHSHRETRSWAAVPGGTAFPLELLKGMSLVILNRRRIPSSPSPTQAPSGGQSDECGF